MNVLIDLLNLNLETNATFDFITKSILPTQGETKRSRQLLRDYSDWLPSHFLRHNCDLSKLEKLEIKFWADIAQAGKPNGISDTIEFTVYATARWKAESRDEEIIEIRQVEFIKRHYLKLGLPEF